jgi:uncharacterized protein YecT (DUF1311 family)
MITIQKKIALVLIILSAYLGSWLWRVKLGIARSTANLRYFYYVQSPGSYDSSTPRPFIDNLFYYFYYPIYKPYYTLQKIMTGERYDVHWSDRASVTFPINPSEQNCDLQQTLTQLDMNICANFRYETANKQLLLAWQAYRANLNGEKFELAMQEQITWEKTRRVFCDKEVAKYDGGSMQPLMRSMCLESKTKEKLLELNKLLLQN